LGGLGSLCFSGEEPDVDGPDFETTTAAPEFGGVGISVMEGAAEEPALAEALAFEELPVGDELVGEPTGAETELPVLGETAEEPIPVEALELIWLSTAPLVPLVPALLLPLVE
jgi:hypothetical protein